VKVREQSPSLSSDNDCRVPLGVGGSFRVVGATFLPAVMLSQPESSAVPRMYRAAEPLFREPAIALRSDMVRALPDWRF
jgi:hypothetical protein